MSSLSVHEVTTYSWSLEEDIFHYQEQGIDAVGLWRPKFEDFGTEKTCELLQETNYPVSSVSYAGGFTGTRELTFDEAIEEGKEVIDFASQVQAETVLLASGPQGGHINKHARRIVKDALRMLGDHAADRCVTLALQPMHRMHAEEWTFLHTLEETVSLLDECNESNIKLAFGTYHLWREENLTTWINDLVRLTQLVQISDWREPPRSEFDRALPGEGIIPLEEIIGAFLAAGYQRYFEVEIWSEKHWVDDSKYPKILQRCRDWFHGMMSD